MSYATLSQVQNEFKQVTFTAAGSGSPTAVTIEDITQFLSDADAEVNSRLRVKYQTPITGTESLVVIAMIEIWLVKHRVLEILKVKSGIAKTDQDGPKTYRQMALDLLNDLAAGKAVLTDALLATSADGVRSYTSDNSIPNTFDRTIDQW